MPSQIGQAGNIVDIAANYLKTKPSTRFATRQLGFFNVAISGVHTNWRNSDSAYSRAVRAIQTQAEIFAVGLPASGNFVVVVGQDTANDGDNTDLADNGEIGYNAFAQTLSTATGGTVTQVHLSGSGFTSGWMAYGDTSAGDGVYKDEGEAI